MRNKLILVVLVIIILAGVFFAGNWVSAHPLRSLNVKVPTLVSYQGLVKVSDTPYSGAGYFKFAIVNSKGTVSFWSNDGSSTAGSEPTGSVQLAVGSGLFNVLLGDLSLTGMDEALFDARVRQIIREEVGAA